MPSPLRIKLPTGLPLARLGHRNPQLCPRCSDLRFPSLPFETDSYRVDEHLGYVASLGKFSSLVRHPDCPLCQLLLSVTALQPGNLSAFESETLSGNLSLYAFTEANLLLGDQRAQATETDTTTFYTVFPDHFFPDDEQTYLYMLPKFLGHWEVSSHLMPRGWITRLKSQYSQLSNFAARSIQPHELNYSLIRNWILDCREKHGDLCMSASQGSMAPFRVIDCEKQELIPAPSNCQYVALSYVWGTEKSTPPIGNRLPSDSPQLIKDAITLSLKLGFTYLWVDRFCISQDNPSEKHEQIQQMNLIYSNAQLTIIDAAGSDTSYGLPGVSRPRAYVQSSVSHGNDTLVSTFPDASTMIQGSKWLTRGWTYQEALLSKRKLVITDYQAYFECPNMHCYEAVNSPSCRWVDGLQYGNCSCRRSSLFTFGDVHPRSLAAWKLIINYTRRTLSRQEDILDAIHGVIREFQHANNPFYFIWGIPVPGNTSSKRERTASFRNRVATALCWRLETPGSRRLGFPSWSWTGWIGAVGGWVGPVDFQSFLPVMVCDFASPQNQPLVFEIEHVNGTTQGLEEYVSTPQPSTPALSRHGYFLHVTAHSITASLHSSRPGHSKSPANEEWWARCSIAGNQFIWAVIDLTTNSELIDESLCTGLLLGSAYKDYSTGAMLVMLTQEHSKEDGDSYHERIGFIVIWLSHGYTPYRKFRLG